MEIYGKNGLEWIAGPDKDTTWDEAKAWVENLSLDSHGWRMPTIAELRSLYRKGAEDRNMTLLLKTTSWWVWADKIAGSLATRHFDFYNGDDYKHPCKAAYGSRGFAVRSRPK